MKKQKVDLEFVKAILCDFGFYIFSLPFAVPSVFFENLEEVCDSTIFS